MCFTTDDYLMIRTTRCFLSLLLVLLLCVSFAARADDYTVLGSGADQLLWNDLLTEFGQLDVLRDQAHADSLASPQALTQRQTQMRADFAKMVGHLPDEKTPLNPQVTGTINVPGENYKIEKIIYESRPGHHVTANLYLPTDVSGPVPGVLIPCGHSNNGKAYEGYQKASILMAKNGMAALIFDPISQGERLQIYSSTKSTTAHTLQGIGARALGMTAATYEIWDAVRSLDYLISRPEVNGELIGMSGNSGGGTQTAWMMAFDDRIDVAAPSCFITDTEHILNTIGPQDCEQHFPNQGKNLLDHADFITMRAPKPTRILAAEQDFFPFAGTQQTYADAQAVYNVLGAADAVDLFSYDDPHGWSQPRREAAVQWMKQWLLNDPSPVVEPANLQTQTDAALRCTQTGQVRLDYANEVIVPDLNLAYAQQTATARAAFWNENTPQDCRTEIRQLLGIDGTPAAPSKTNQGIIDRDGYRIEKLTVQRDDEIPLPGLLFIPDQVVGQTSATIYIDAAGKASSAAVGGAVEQLVNNGQIVLSLDLCGYGETKDPQSAYDNDEFRTAMQAMYNGRSLVGRRVEEVLASLDILLQRSDVDTQQINLVGVGAAATVAMHAAALDTRFTHVELNNPAITSWIDDVVAHPLSKNQLGHIVPGALEKYDLPDLQQLMPNTVITEPEPRQRIAYRWSFDTNLNEDTGLLNGSTVGNATVQTAAGAFHGSGAVYFDGNNDAISIDKAALGEGPFTIAFWSKTHTDGSAGYFISDSSEVTNLFLRRYPAGDNSTFNGWISEVQFGQLGPDGTNSTSWPNDTWHHHVVTVDGYGRQSWYVNGQLLQRLSGTDFEGLSSNLYLGNRADLERDFKGWLDDLQIYNWSVSDEDAIYLYNNPGKLIPTELIPGDANADGRVDDQDAIILANNWQTAAATWAMGDFNDDGVVDEADATLLAANWQSTVDANATVPEPTTLVLLAIGTFWMLKNRPCKPV